MSEWRSNAHQCQPGDSTPTGTYGNRAKAAVTCGHCGGEGHVLVHTIGSFMVRTIRRPCPVCLGSGVKP